MNVGVMSLELDWSGTEQLAKIVAQGSFDSPERRVALMKAFERRHRTLAREARELFEDALAALDENAELEHEVFAMTMHAITLKELASAFEVFLDALSLGARPASALRLAFPDSDEAAASAA